MRKKIVAGNWKMNKNFPEAVSLASAVAKELSHRVVPAHFEAVLIPPFPFLRAVSEITFPFPHLQTGAQNCASERSGAFTGEVSAEMVNSCGATYVIIGHSERRNIFNESCEMIKSKISMALNAGLIAIVCIGESKSQREDGSYKDIIKEQLKDIYEVVLSGKLSHLVIAYEPVWAIGTGLTATPDQAEEVHSFIREQLINNYGKEGATVSLLYGGSCNPTNAQQIFARENIDGGLIGGASLDPEQFIAIFDALPHWS
jgi:triosephosphate isomerase (TIM)